MFRLFGIDDGCFARVVRQYIGGEHDIWRLKGEIVELRVWSEIV